MVAILTHILIKWAYNWNELYTFLILIADVIAGAFAVSLYYTNEPKPL